MKIIFSAILTAFILLNYSSYSCNSCGGGTGDLAVLSLDGIALFNTGFTYDNYTGVWDKDSKWRSYDYSLSQVKIIFNGAYRFSKNLQFAVSMPFVINNSSIPQLKQNGSGFGDLTIGGRIEFTHEFQPQKKGKKLMLDKTLPYTALTFGLTVPTGKSEETAENDVDITGKGFYTTSLGISLTKSIIKSKFQVLADLNWQHSFEKNYKSYYGIPFNSDYRKRPGDKFNYSLTLNYIFNSWHAVSLTASGFSQSDYTINDTKGVNSNERSSGMVLSYTYYPSIPFRITASVKTGLPVNDFGKNAQGSTAFNINFTYYLSDLNVK